MERDLYRRHFELEASHWWFRGRRRILLAILAPRLRRRGPVRILDAGCGTGYNLKTLEPFGPAFGCDLSEDALAYCRRRGLARLARADAARLPFRDGAFGLLTLLDVLYHRWIADDAAVLREAARVLEPGGFLLVTDSAFKSLSGPHDEAFHGRERYTRKVLADRIRGAGFEIERAGYFNFFLFPLVWLVRRIERRRYPAGAGAPRSDLKPVARPLNALLSLVLGVEAGLSRRLNLPFGSSVIILARKPVP